MKWILHGPETPDNFESWISVCGRFEMVYQNLPVSVSVKWVVWHKHHRVGAWATRAEAEAAAYDLLPPLEQLARQA
jgi:hypothetical protein